MVALDPHFALLAVQCMVLLAALPSSVTAVVVRSPHSNSPGHFRQRDPHPVHSPTKHHALSSTSGTSKRRKPRDVRFCFLLNDNSLITKQGSHAAGFQAKKTRVLQARDSPLPNSLQTLLGSVLGDLTSLTDTLKNVLTGLVPRHHDRDEHCHDCDEYIDRSHVHEHNQHEVTVYNRRDMDSVLVPGTVVVTVNINIVSSRLVVLIKSRMTTIHSLAF